ncbi:MAG: hypothetical protein R3246_12565 [Acidimicrobiia bacterium]|nr:hypothetical protein [Acidimicrobiia bacterium]
MLKILITTLALASIGTACGDDSAGGSATAPVTTAPPTTPATTTAPPTTAFACPVTRAPDTAFHPPGDRIDPHPVGPWYGTEELWTVLPPDGVHDERKSIWWSVNFPGGEFEEQPDITVVGRRLDAEAADIVSVHPGTNGYTVDDGWFMLADFPFELPGGCWEITATYKGASLSYTVESR